MYFIECGDIQHNSHSDRQYVSDRSSIETLSSANAAGRIQRQHIREELSPQEEVDNTTALQSGQGPNKLPHASRNNVFFEQGFLRVRNDPVRIWLCKMLIQASKSFTSVVYCTVNSTPSRVLSVRENVNSLFLPLRESRPLRADMPSLWLWRKLWMFCLFLVCRKRHKLICHKKNKKHGVFLLELQRNFELNSLKASLFPVLVLSGVWGVGC